MPRLIYRQRQFLQGLLDPNCSRPCRRIEDVHRHPERLATWVDRYLEDERFGRVIREMYNEVFC